MNEKVVNQILNYLDNLGKAISSGAKESFTIIVKQQVSLGIVDGAWCVILLAVFTSLIFVFIKMYKNYVPRKYGEDMSGFIIAGIIFMIAFDFLTLFCLTRCVMHIMNPEFFAIQYILDTITGKNN